MSQNLKLKKAEYIVLIFVMLWLSPFAGNTQIIKQKIPDKLVVLTFDDAVVSQYKFVAPLLKEHGFGATFFICEFPPNFSDKSKYMNWQQIKELGEMGFEIANHTRTHPAVGGLTENEFIKELEYIENKCDSFKIEKPLTFAYPGYSISPQVVDVLKKKGYCFARAGGSRAYQPGEDNPLLVPSWAMTSDNKTQIMEALEQARGGNIVVLTIHGVPDTEHPWVTTPTELFAEYINYLSENNFKVIALRDLLKYIDTEKAITILQPDFKKPLKN